MNEAILAFNHALWTVFRPGCLAVILLAFTIFAALTFMALKDGTLGFGWIDRLVRKTWWLPWIDDVMRELDGKYRKEKRWKGHSPVAGIRLALLTAATPFILILGSICAILTLAIMGTWLSALAMPAAFSTEDHVALGTFWGINVFTILAIFYRRQAKKDRMEAGLKLNPDFFTSGKPHGIFFLGPESGRKSNPAFLDSETLESRRAANLRHRFRQE